MTEGDTIQQARAGQAAAWETLVQAHQESVFRLAYLLLGDAGEADDAAQETFIRAYRHLDQFDVARSLRPWLLGITAHVARNRRRSLGRYVYHITRMARLTPPAVIDPEQETAKHADAAALWQAIRRLDPDHQEIIYLRFFLELSVDETAETLGIAAGTVKSRLSRALDKLRHVVHHEFPMLRRAADE
ncbi:MAG: RNA polymerase sigma factor [Anaerolineae bacterium]